MSTPLLGLVSILEALFPGPSRFCCQLPHSLTSVCRRCLLEELEGLAQVSQTQHQQMHKLGLFKSSKTYNIWNVTAVRAHLFVAASL